MENLVKVGRLNKTFGLKGHIRSFIEPRFLSRLKKLEVIFLYSNNKPLPYFTDEVNLSESGHGMFHFEEIKDRTAADKLIGKEIFIEEKKLKKIKPFSTPRDYIGFKLMDETLGEVGTLEDILELPDHTLGQFTFTEKEILFPWNEEVIINIDRKKKEIALRLPEGLINVYL